MELHIPRPDTSNARNMVLHSLHPRVVRIPEEKTIIICLGTGRYVVALTDDPEKFLENMRRKKSVYYSQKRHQGEAKIVWSIKGDFKDKIKRFGSGRFIKMTQTYDPLDDWLNRTI